MLIFNFCRFTNTVMKRMLKSYQSQHNRAARPITFDQGREFDQHTKLYQKQMQTYFYDASEPWQKGGEVKNINRRIRGFLPKNSNPKTLYQKTVGQIMKKHSTAYRKCRDFSTLYEIFNAKLKKVVHLNLEFTNR